MTDQLSSALLPPRSVLSRRRVLGLLTASAAVTCIGVGPAEPASAASAIDAATRRREALVLGRYRPSRSTAGYIPGTVFRVTHNHVPKSNTTYRDLDVRNSVEPGPNVTNVTYRNCIFRGPNAAPRSFSSLYVMFRPHKRSFTFIDCTFRPQHPDFRWVGLQGYGFTLRRCSSSKLVDTVQVFNPNNGPRGAGDDSLRNGPCDVVIEQCWFHDSAYWGPAVDTGKARNGSHADSVQWQGGTGLVVRGNYFTGKLKPEYAPNFMGGDTTNSAMMIKPDVGTIGRGVITQNWFGGGAVTINIADAPTKNRYITDLGTISSNHFYRDQFYAPTALLVLPARTNTHKGIKLAATGNRWVVDKRAVPVVTRFQR